VLRVASVHPQSTTAGLSPNEDKRTEVFLAGCRMALSGHPCPGCFNVDLWDEKYFPEVSPEDLLIDVEEAGNKYVTIVGGEPLDQLEELIRFMKLLKGNAYHVVLITHYTMEVIKTSFERVLDYADVIIDGCYDARKRIFDEVDIPGVKHVIGSSNQGFWHRADNEWNKLDIFKDDLRKAYCA